MTGLGVEVQVVVPLVLLVVGRVEAARDDNKGSTSMCLPHIPGSLLGPGEEEPTQGPGPREDSEKHHMPSKRGEVLLSAGYAHSQVLQYEWL